MVCVNIHNFFYICTHTQKYLQKKNVSLSYSIKSATAKNTAERKINIATEKHCSVCRVVAYLFSNSSLPQNETDPTVTSFVHKISKQESLAAISFRTQSSILFLTKCSYNGKNTYWRILLKTQRVHIYTQNRVLRGSMEETLEAGRSLSLPCS